MIKGLSQNHSKSRKR